jgi:antitoxin (DNA-binding transcriptional repressor) of toxin-antitoxin stability system
MRELSLHTAQVMKKLSDSGKPALITLRGRFVAVITPLAPGDMESKLISAALAESAAATHDLLEPVGARSTEEVAEELGVNVPDYKDRDPAE